MKLNKNYSALAFFIALIFNSILLFAQEIPANKEYPTTDFRPPLDLKPALAGSFGEIRANHFHSGLDYRTNQREGYPVYAVADGYISRLRIQIGGFGNAVYITHANGYTSVYAHLQRFNERITQIIQNYQYKIESFDVDFPLLPIEIPVTKGEIIAWSGNTGSSGGPHLHFEIRDSKTEETINPQLFGIDIPDNVKPQISGLYVYRLNGLAFNQNTAKQYFPVSASYGNYILNLPVINIQGETGFGINTFDQQLAGSSKNGVYSIELLLDNKTIFFSALERFAFSNSRAVNSHIDYAAKLNAGVTIQKSFVDPGNPLGIYKTDESRGLIKLTDDEIHELKYIVKDAKGNTSTLQFYIKNIAAPVPTAKINPETKAFKFNEENEFTANNIKLTIPKGVLYNDINFSYSKASKSNAYSEVHSLHSRLTPLHDTFNLWIKPVKPIPEHLKSKALIVNANGGFAAGKWDETDGFVKATPRTFGSYFIAIDSVPPAIKPINISEEKSMTGDSKLILKISDNLSGIKTFRGTIDGQWVLMEFDLKTATLWHTFDYRTNPGKHLFQLTVTDMQQNTKSYTASFYK